MPIYTRTGDDGSSGLIGGQRRSKADPLYDCCGTIDELNAALGLAGVGADAGLASWLREAQNDLFVIGANLALPPGSVPPEGMPSLEAAMVRRLEEQIDAASAQLPPLRQFILPGGSETAARLHLARAVCRRAERRVVGYAQSHPVPPLVIIFLNRLSDWLFVMARLANHRAGVEDWPWRKA